MAFDGPTGQAGHEAGALGGQVVRYAVSGLLITVAFSAFYWLLAAPGGLDANLALAIAFAVFFAVSFITHGRYTFRGHGSRDRMPMRTMRYAFASIAAFLLNQFFVWLLVKQMGGAAWWPTIAFVFVTPWLTFALNRKWVYA